MFGCVVDYLNTQLKEKKLEMRTCLTNEVQHTWTKVLNLIERLNQIEQENRQAIPIFHTMILHMGLQLFSDPEMAVKSIDELESCYQRLMKNSPQMISDKEDEPEWVEVVVDLILSFLSINSHLLRSLVGCVFPHICQFLTRDAIYQILAVTLTIFFLIQFLISSNQSIQTCYKHNRYWTLTTTKKDSWA